MYFLSRFGASCKSVAPVPPAGLCRGSSSPSKGNSTVSNIFHQLSLSSDSFFSVNISTFLKDFYVPILLQTRPHQHKLGNLSEQILKGSASHVWLCCQNCWPAPLPASADPVRLIMRQRYVFLIHWKSKAGAHLKFPRDWTHRHCWWFIYICI